MTNMQTKNINQFLHSYLILYFVTNFYIKLFRIQNLKKRKASFQLRTKCECENFNNFFLKQ
jgi:hypothetical protein